MSWALGGALAALATAGAGAWWWGPAHFRDPAYWSAFVAGRAGVFVLSVIVLAAILHARQGGATYVRRIPGLTAIDETVGRATEMGRPITFSLGLSKQLDIIALQALAICLHVVRLAIRFGTRVIVTMRNPTVYAVTDEAVSEAYSAAGRPESFQRSDIRFLSDQQFAYASAMMGTIIREKAASNYMFGEFFAESLILAEAGNQVGAIQVAGTTSTTQVPFFIVACDYTIIGEEFYAATAYLTKDPVLCGSLLGQDRSKFLILLLILVGVALSSIAVFAGGDFTVWSTAFAALFTGAK
jgi:hypothetical protein